jgi:2-hydroxy-3-keto-5-methylthiopentenyl-1-phosphate phosphatase
MNNIVGIEPSIRVFCDFDGTITRKDSGDEFFRTFSKFEPAHSDLMNGKDSVKEYYEKVSSELSLTHDALLAFCESCETDAYFGQFLAFIAEKNWNLSIVSDGFDIYIDRILKLINAEHIPAYRNVMERQESSGTWKPIFPNADERCKCFCASCKTKIVLGKSHPDDMIIYIGDGLSDTCPVHLADMIFAKGSLSSYCNQHGIVHHNWNSFFDILQVLKKRTPVLRDIARKERKKAFIAE